MYFFSVLLHRNFRKRIFLHIWRTGRMEKCMYRLYDIKFMAFQKFFQEDSQK